MSLNCRDVLEVALQLSDEDRGFLAQRLLETLSPENAELSDHDLAVELDGRLEEAYNDPRATVSWAELRDER